MQRGRDVTVERYQQVAEAVFVLEGPVVTISAEDIAFVRQRAVASKLGRARICVHPSNDDPLHQMLIALHDSTYVPPHKHVGKSESFHVIEGRVAIGFFTDDGALSYAIELGCSGHNLPFMHRLSEPYFHAVVPVTETVVFQEITNGPFQPGDMTVASWAPAANDAAAIATLKSQVIAAARKTPN